MSVYPKLSPRRQLPSWSRPSLSNRSLKVGKLSRDVPLTSHTELIPREQPSRAHQLEKNIIFLKQQHRETLQQLHEEIERLKNENRELNFKLIMCTCGHVSRGRSTNSRGKRSGGRGHLETGWSPDEGYDREEEIRRLRNALGSEKNKNRHLISVIERKVLEYKKSSSDPSESDLANVESGSSSCTAQPLGDQLFHHPSRQPTIKECETVIKQLQHQNGQQTHELMQIKADLRDVLYSHKWTPDAYLLARAYVADESSSDEPSQSNSAENTTSLPDVPNKFHNVKIVERAYQRVKEEVTLPALKPKLPATVVADRHRRQQALRTKLSRSVI